MRAFEPARSGSEMVLQRTITDRPSAVRPLYWRATRTTSKQDAQADLMPDGGIRIGPSTTLHFDTYFGAFFEQHWRTNTHLDELAIRVRAEGRFRFQLWRRSLLGRYLLHEQIRDGEATVAVPSDPEIRNYRQCGLLCFSVTALDEPILFRGAEWITSSLKAAPVGLAAVICTFNRETDVARILSTLADDLKSLDVLARIYLVNQGRPGLAQKTSMAGILPRYGNKLRLVEQQNFGGAGGFTRGLLEALDDSEVTHTVLLDDDIRLEPESLARMAAFFSLADGDFPVGGHMLDLFQPTRLFEAGAIIADRNWAFLPQHHMTDLTRPDQVLRLHDAVPVHYNGWWCLGLPLRLIREMGLPLPCFIRGDDMEFGLRLHQRGVYTIPLPGVAVWHEPFYVRIGGSQLYYETRNMLIAAALHFSFDRRAVAIRMIKHLLIHLLTFRYYSAALVVRGINDFLAGPEILERDPALLHASLEPLRTKYTPTTTSRLIVLAPEPVRALPVRRVGYAMALAGAVLRNWMARTRRVPPRRINIRDFAWITLTRADHVALDTGWDLELPTLHRSRESFREISLSGAEAVSGLYKKAPVLAREWRKAAARLTSEPFWRSYLGLPAPATETPRLQMQRETAEPAVGE